MKLLYYLAAIGEPDLNKKTHILLSNLLNIHKNILENFDVLINCYDTINDNKLYNLIKNLNFINIVYFYKKKGVLTELFLTNPYNSHVNKYDYIVFILDDVRILNINLKNMIKIKEKYDIKFLSPKVIKSTHSFMNENNNLTINNFLEVYFLLLNPINFYKFISLYSVENKWMWGVDFLFGYYGIKTGVINNYSVLHELPKKADTETAKKCLSEFLQNNTPFNSINEIKKKYNPVISYIKLD
jgi:hypothetical protein